MTTKIGVSVNGAATSFVDQATAGGSEIPIEGTACGTLPLVDLIVLAEIARSDAATNRIYSSCVDVVNVASSVGTAIGANGVVNESNRDGWVGIRSDKQAQDRCEHEPSIFGNFHMRFILLLAMTTSCRFRA